MVYVQLKVAALLVLILAGDAVPPTARPAAPTLRLEGLLPGDLVFRAGRGARADLVRVAGRGPWSHVGLLDRGADGRWVVVHAAPPEAGDKGGVTVTPLTDFASPAKASTLAAYRVVGLDPNLRARLIRDAHRLAHARVPFDQSLDLADCDALYCTEFVARMFAGSGADLGAEPSTLSVGGLGVRILMPHDLIAARRLRRVA